MKYSATTGLAVQQLQQPVQLIQQLQSVLQPICPRCCDKGCEAEYDGHNDVRGFEKVLMMIQTDWWL